MEMDLPSRSYRSGGQVAVAPWRFASGHDFVRVPRLPFLLPLCLVLLLLLPGGCAGPSEDSGTSPIQRHIFSPNGEPLNGGALGMPGCSEALARWFDRVDSDHDGTIERTEFLDDAKRQFAVMDLNRDGVITPAELSLYRAPFAIRRKKGHRGPRPEDELKNTYNVPESHRKDDTDVLADYTDPVMIADRQLRNKVSEEDFLAYARQNFAELNLARDGRLTRAELLKTCSEE
jgi:hypothetical protein